MCYDTYVYIKEIKTFLIRDFRVFSEMTNLSNIVPTVSMHMHIIDTQTNSCQSKKDKKTCRKTRY
jgi:hypothetical protein